MQKILPYVIPVRVAFEKPITARYIRFKGYGNTENAWSSVLEFTELSKL